MRKKICVSLPCYNEEENVVELSQELVDIFENELSEYDYELQFIDNCSTDNTQKLLTQLCEENKHITAIFNTKNFGGKSGFYGCLQTYGDCTICMATDFQTPSEMIPQFVREWEKGACIVAAVKTSSDENFIKYKLRSLYYHIIKKFSDVDIIEHFTGFGLYDRKFIDFLRELDDPLPTMRGVVAEFGYDIVKIPFNQSVRRHGKSSHSLYSLYNMAIDSFVSYTKIGIRFASILGFLFSLISFIVAIVYLILKLVLWNDFQMGTAPILIGVFLIGSVQLFFIGVIGEYIMNINKRLIHRPLVVEKKRLNFEKEQET